MTKIEEFESLVARIKDLDASFLAKAQARQDSLIKPLGALGKLEDMAVRIAAMHQSLSPQLTHAEIHCYAADHGIAEEGVSAYPQEVSAQMIDGVAAGLAGVSNLAKSDGIEVRAYNVGLKTMPKHPSVINHPIMPGTHNFLHEDALTKDAALEAIYFGAREVEKAVFERELDICGLGEVGIANTTSAAALIVSLTGCSVEEATGRGTGLDDRGLAHKVAVIKEALKAREPYAKDGLELLCHFGGLEIAAMVGTILGASALQKPFVVDGQISASALLIAHNICPKVLNYCFVSHKSKEPGLMIALDHLGLEPYLDLDMRLGEGSGAALGISIIKAACMAMSGMASFDEAQVSKRKS